MSSVRLVIITAAAREAAAVRRALQVRARRRLGTGRCWTGDTAGVTAALVRAGVGLGRAGAAAQEALETFRPRALCVLGFAGALRTGVTPATLMLAETTGPAGGSMWAGDLRLLDAAQAAAAVAGIPFVRGGLVSAGALVGTPEGKAALAAATGAMAVDMEAAAVAAVADGAGLPFMAAKVIFDAADEALPPILMRVVRPNGSPRIFYAASRAARDRDLRAALHWAGRRSLRAAAVLTRFCRTFLPMLGVAGAGPP